MKRITGIRIVHTAIWIFFNVVIFYLLYAVITNRIDMWVWICIGVIVAEGLVLGAFKTICPVTLIARKYSTSKKANFDIYLPEWLARNNKLIYTIFFIIIIFILIYQLNHGR